MKPPKENNSLHWRIVHLSSFVGKKTTNRSHTTKREREWSKKKAGHWWGRHNCLIEKVCSIDFVLKKSKFSSIILEDFISSWFSVIGKICVSSINNPFVQQCLKDWANERTNNKSLTHAKNERMKLYFSNQRKVVDYCMTCNFILDFVSVWSSIQLRIFSVEVVWENSILKYKKMSKKRVCYYYDRTFLFLFSNLFLFYFFYSFLPFWWKTFHSSIERISFFSICCLVPDIFHFKKSWNWKLLLWPWTPNETSSDQNDTQSHPQLWTLQKVVCLCILFFSFVFYTCGFISLIFLNILSASFAYNTSRNDKISYWWLYQFFTYCHSRKYEWIRQTTYTMYKTKTIFSSSLSFVKYSSVLFLKYESWCPF